MPTDPSCSPPCPRRHAASAAAATTRPGSSPTPSAGATGHSVENLLDRVSGERTQTTLQPAARAANVAGAFLAARPVDGAHIVLVDDVLTTGATAAECARALAAAGACCTGLVTFARAFDIRGPDGLRQQAAN
jgi:hypothetical protein